ncbi:keratin-associated protein 24-1 [Sorex fumeus]|uniref:keratin-associated protein 24-1 n=1 Tax=Sorex fumeus TaxID=62283 RepID=UPI0024AD3E25|nr:keratin-associated protein 24-1 [Sorex fumeus]
MHPNSMSFLGSPGGCSGTSYRTYCYIPVTSAALCSSDVSPTFGLSLPSRYQGNLWLLDNCQESYGEVPGCESPSCEVKTDTTTCDGSNFCVPCNSSAVGKVCGSCETTNTGPAPSGSPGAHSKGYVSDCYPKNLRATKATPTPSSGSKYFGQRNRVFKSFQPLNHYSGGFGYRNYQNLAFTPSCFISSSYQAQNYPPRKSFQYSNYGPMRGQPLSYFPGNFRSLSCLPSTFPPLRYLCSGCRPLDCY